MGSTYGIFTLGGGFPPHFSFPKCTIEGTSLRGTGTPVSPPLPLPMALGVVNTFAAHYSFSSSKKQWNLLINAKGSLLHRYVYGISLQQIIRTFRLRPSNRIFLSWNMSTCLHVLFSLPVSTWRCGTAYMAALYIMGMQKCTLIYLYFPTRLWDKVAVSHLQRVCYLLSSLKTSGLWNGSWDHSRTQDCPQLDTFLCMVVQSLKVSGL